MRKVTYYINDHAYMRELFKEAENLENIMTGLPDPFVCIYTLTALAGPGHSMPVHDSYELTDIVGRKIDINSLNGYQKGVILCDCQRHFAGKCEKPFGVVKIEEVWTE